MNTLTPQPASYPLRDRPATITLPVREGVQPSGKPPVRIFLGTEPAQYRAERVFVWSVEQHRDPSRVYEISLMKRLTGFDDRRWLTGFTNYRFAIPHYAGSRGRAIYNDTDQLYLDDPAKLFDLEMGEHGYLAVSPRDTSVMLLNCERMARVWPIDRARRWRKNRLIDRALAESSCYGKLGGEWNARDQEYVAGRSKLIHFTTIHKQPWRPFPDRYVYQPNPAGEVFFASERAADAAGYQVFTRARPSEFFSYAKSRLPCRAAGEPAPLVAAALEELIERGAPLSILHLDDSSNILTTLPAAPVAGAVHQRSGLFKALAGDGAGGSFDGVVCSASLARLPVDDIPWVIDEIVRQARSFVLLAINGIDDARDARIHQGTVLSADWWASLLEMAAARHPQVHWSLILAHGEDYSATDTVYRQGGRFLGPNAPLVWLLEDHKPGHTTQSLGLVNALDWPYRRIKLEFGPLAARPNFLRGPTLRGLTERSAQQLRAPWPDLVVASGARSAPVAEWIRRESKGRTRTVLLGRKGAHLGNEFDLSVAPAYVGLYPDPRRIETTVPLTRVRQTELDEAAKRWLPVLGAAASPRIALLVGGDDSVHALDTEQARRMGGEVGTLARDAGGSVFVTTSRRTDTDAARALVDALGNVTVHSYHWSRAHTAEENPYFGYLALADILIVSGESASMLAEATATGKPVLIYPLAKRGNDTHRVKFLFGQSVSDWIMRRAFARPVNRRGLERPQTGIELFCAKLAAGGWVRPHGDITKLHDALIERGVARYFDGDLPHGTAPPMDEATRVAERVRSLIGVAPAPCAGDSALKDTGPDSCGPRAE